MIPTMLPSFRLPLLSGPDAVEEYMACKMHSLAGFCFESVSVGTTIVSKVETCLTLFPVGAIAAEHAERFLAEVEMEAEKVLGSFGPREYDALALANISNVGRWNQVFKQMGVLYAPQPLPGSEASQAANKKWKAKVSKKPAAKKMKAGLGRAPSSKTTPLPAKIGSVKKVGVLKVTRLKTKLGLQGTSEIELALAKTVGVSKKFHPLDVVASSHGPRTVGITTTHAARVPTFDNLRDDSFADVRGTPSPKRMTEKCASPPLPLFGEFWHLSFTLFVASSDKWFADPTCVTPLLDLPLGNLGEDLDYFLHRVSFMLSSFRFVMPIVIDYFASQALALSEKRLEKRGAEVAQMARTAELEAKMNL
jgi:hypothetical protein